MRVVDGPPVFTSKIQGGTSAPGSAAPSRAGQFYSAEAAAQDMAVVGERLWLFDQSNIYHSTAKGWVYNASSLALVGQFTHNISHAATVSYQRDSDTLMLGNAGDANSSGPRIDLFPRFSAYAPGAFLDWYNPQTTPRLTIPLLRSAPDGTALRFLFPGQNVLGVNAVWIDNRTILAFAGGTAMALSAARLKLGTGAEDFSGAGFGTFRSGLAATEYNGTAILLDQYACDLMGTTQGAEWHNGKLYLGWTSSIEKQRALEVLELSLTSDGRIALLTDWQWLPTSANSTPLEIEAEGVAFHGTDLLVTGRRYANNAQGIYVFSNIG